MKQQTPVCTYDFTLRRESSEIEELKGTLQEHCKKWCFQLEEGSRGYLHYQGRMSLKTKQRMTAVKKLFPKEIHLSPTSNENRDNNFYVVKLESRVDGPWSNQDRYVPRQIREIKELYAWQQYIINNADVWDTRTINIVIDEHGCNGKSILRTYIGVHQIGRSIPYSNDYRDIMRMVMGTKKVPLYIIDIPRGIRKEQLYQFFSGIESLKDGYAYDDRYSFKEEYFDCPNIWIFMNHRPDSTRYLSKDRWKFWTLDNKVLTLTTMADDDV